MCGRFSRSGTRSAGSPSNRSGRPWPAARSSMRATFSIATTGDAPHSITRALAADPLTIADHEPAEVTFTVACRAHLPRGMFELSERAIDTDSTGLGAGNRGGEHIRWTCRHDYGRSPLDGSARTVVEPDA